MTAGYFEHITEACDFHDCEVLTDLDGNMRPCYFIGWRDDLDAGIREGRITPHFSTLEELDNWLSQQNIENLDE